VKTLTLVDAGTGRDREETRRLEAADLAPRVLLYEDALNSDILDEDFLRRAPPARARAYRHLPTGVAQVLEAHAVRRRYDAVVSWSDRIGLAFAGLSKLTRARGPHVAILMWISPRKKAELLRRVHSHIDRLIIPAPLQREFAIGALGVPASKVVALPWSIDVEFWRPMPGPADMICAVGSEMRDYPTLLEALRGLPVRCHIAAGTTRSVRSPWVESIDRSGPLPPNVTVGKLPPAELRRLYARSRFVVIPLVPGDSDNGITSIVEAMAMGKAVICSRTRGQVGVVLDGETGLYVPAGDPRALQEAVRHLWGHPEVAERMGRAGRARVEQGHRFEDFVSRVRDLVEETIAASRHGAGR
jgi:glycosyltransferase involved in cell wall biosynthesis